MKFNKQKQALICVLFLSALSLMARAERVTTITIEDVGLGGNNAYVSTLDGFSGKFSFADLLSNDSDPNQVPPPPYYLGSTLAFTTDVADITTASANATGSFSTGFLFAGKPFVPKTGGPINMDISIVAGNPVLTLDTPANPGSSLPFNGDYGDPGSILSFILGPQTVAESDSGGCPGTHTPFTVRWINRIGNTDQYNYKMVWTHCITAAEDPSFSFVGNRAAWILEGIMTAPDTTAPTVLSTSPVTNPNNSSTSVATDRSGISVTFSEAMEASTINATTFVVSTGGGNNECNSYTSNVDGTIWTCNLIAPLQGSALYDIVLTTGITDSAADTAVPLDAASAAAVRQFTTAAGADLIPPTLASSNPADGATDVPVDSTVSLTFSDDSQALGDTLGSMNASATGGAISVSNSNGTVAGSVATADGLTYVFTPASELDGNTTYTVNVDGTSAAGVQDGSGNLLGADVTLSFTTAAVSSIDILTGTVTVPGGINIISVAGLSAAQVGGTQPDLVALDDNFLDYTINGVTPGGTVTVTIDFKTDLTGRNVFKAVGGVFTELVEGAGSGQYELVNNTTIDLHITDNDGQFDSDSTAGVIRDPIGTGTPIPPDPVPGSLGGGGWWLLMVAPIVIGLRRYNKQRYLL